MFLFTFILKSTAIVLKDCCMEPGLIALTFDDGPTGHTADVLEMLEDNDCKASFHFTTHNRARGNIRSLYKQALDQGHTVGLRVHPGRNYEQMSPDEVNEEIESQVQALRDATGEEKIQFARAPVEYGDVNTDVYNALMQNSITQTGYMYCLYDDASDPKEAIANYTNILSDSNPKYDSFIFLLHDEKEKTFPLVEEMIEIGREKGYEFVTLDQCLSGYSPEEGTTEGRRKKRKSGVADLMAFNASIFALLTM